MSIAPWQTNTVPTGNHCGVITPEALVNAVVPSEPPPRPLAASVMQAPFKDEPLAARLRDTEGVTKRVGHEVTVTADKTLLITNAPSMFFGIRPY